MKYPPVASDFSPASPGPIGGTTPSSGAFTTVTANNGIQTGVSGESDGFVTIRNDDVLEHSVTIKADDVTGEWTQQLANGNGRIGLLVLPPPINSAVPGFPGAYSYDPNYWYWWTPDSGWLRVMGAAF